MRISDGSSDVCSSDLVRAVGVDLIVRESGIAKTSLYRHFATKDVLVAAFLKVADGAFWRHWDAVAAKHFDDPAVELDAHLECIGPRLRRPGYRGCPQLNLAAAYADPPHPAHRDEVHHQEALRRRLNPNSRRTAHHAPARAC